MLALAIKQYLEKSATELPYRAKSEVTLVGPNKTVVAQNGHGYWELPGGGIDKGEKPVEAAIRELKEETGLVAGKLKRVGTSKFEFPKSWEKNLKRDGMASKYKGMKVTHFIGDLSEVGSPTSDEGDDWKKVKFYDAKEVAKKLTSKKEPEMEEYRKVQETVLSKVAAAAKRSLAHKDSRRNRQGANINRTTTRAQHHTDRMKGMGAAPAKGSSLPGVGSGPGNSAAPMDKHTNYYAKGGVLSSYIK